MAMLRWPFNLINYKTKKNYIALFFMFKSWPSVAVNLRIFLHWLCLSINSWVPDKQNNKRNMYLRFAWLSFDIHCRGIKSSTEKSLVPIHTMENGKCHFYCKMHSHQSSEVSMSMRLFNAIFFFVFFYLHFPTRNQRKLLYRWLLTIVTLWF